MAKILSYFRGLDVVSIGTRTTKNPLIIKWIQRTDPLLALLAFQGIGFLIQMIIFLLPLGPKEEEFVTIVGALNLAFTLLNTALFIHKNKDDLP